MMIQGSYPMLGMCHVYNLSPGTLTHCGWGHGDVEM
jgi:hypothetical protein